MNVELIENNLRYLLLGNWPEGAVGGLLLTLCMSLVAGLLASAGGLLGGILLVMGQPWLRRGLGVIIAVLRAIPVLMLIFWCSH